MERKSYSLTLKIQAVEVLAVMRIVVAAVVVVIMMINKEIMKKSAEEISRIRKIWYGMQSMMIEINNKNFKIKGIRRKIYLATILTFKFNSYLNCLIVC